MATQITVEITALPAAPDPNTQTPAAFAQTAADSVLAQRELPTEINLWSAEVNLVAEEVETNALAAEDAATNAAAAALAASTAANATQWVSGTYATGVCTWSPITYHTYRRTATSPGADATDPSAAPTLWVDLTPSDLTTQRISGSQTLVAGVSYTIYGNGTYTLPAIAGAADRIGITVLAGVTAAIIAPAGADKIRGVAGNMTVDNAPFSHVIRDTGATDGWV